MKPLVSLSRRRFLTHSALAGGIALAPSRWIRRAWADDNPIVVGSLHDQSGAIASTGVPMVNALKLAIDKLNAQGGLLGRPLRLQHYDTQSTMQLYAQYAHRLIMKDQVDVIFGGITSASREAIRPIMSRYDTPYFYAPLYEGGVCDRNTFCTGTTPAQTVAKLVPYAMEQWGKKAYILAADYNYGQITAKWMQKYVKEQGGEVLSVDFFPLDVTNFGSTISRIQNSRPDFVLSALVGGNHTSFYRQWHSAGMKPRVPIASTTFGLVNEPETLSAAESEGILTSYGYFQELDNASNVAFIAAMHAAYGSHQPYIAEPAAATYESVLLWAKGVALAGKASRLALIDALETDPTVLGPSGEVMLDRDTHHTVRNAYLARVENKAYKVIASYPQQPPADTAMICNLTAHPTDNQQYVVDI